MNRKTRLITLSLSLLAIGCSSEDQQIRVEESSVPQLDRDRQFMVEIAQRYENPGMTGLTMLELAYDYCGEMVEGATLEDLYARIDMMDEDDRSIHGDILDLAINTICVSDSGN